jgi:hypothetical protein
MRIARVEAAALPRKAEVSGAWLEVQPTVLSDDTEPRADQADHRSPRYRIEAWLSGNLAAALRSCRIWSAMRTGA